MMHVKNVVNKLFANLNYKGKLELNVNYVKKKKIETLINNVANSYRNCIRFRVEVK